MGIVTADPPFSSSGRYQLAFAGDADNYQLISKSPLLFDDSFGAYSYLREEANSGAAVALDSLLGPIRIEVEYINPFGGVLRMISVAEDAESICTFYSME